MKDIELAGSAERKAIIDHDVHMLLRVRAASVPQVLVLSGDKERG